MPGSDLSSAAFTCFIRSNSGYAWCHSTQVEHLVLSILLPILTCGCGNRVASGPVAVTATAQPTHRLKPLTILYSPAHVSNENQQVLATHTCKLQSVHQVWQLLETHRALHDVYVKHPYTKRRPTIAYRAHLTVSVADDGTGDSF